MLRSRRISRRTVQTIGLSGLAAGTLSGLAAIALVGLSTAQANAAAGAQAGALTISPSSGPVTATGLTYATTTACPSGKNGSAVVRVVDPRTGQTPNISQVNNSVAAPFHGAITVTFAQVVTLYPDVKGATTKLAVFCFPSASAVGTPVAVQDTFVTIDAAGAHYTISGSGGTTANATATSTQGAASTGGDTIPVDTTVASGASGASGASATPAAAPATGGGTGPGSNLALAATGAAVVLAGGVLILLAWQRRRQGAEPSAGA